MTKYYRNEQAMKSRSDLTGERFGRLTVIDMIYIPNHTSIAKCVCECGNIIERPITYLTTGDTKSCGECGYGSEMTSLHNTKDFTGVTTLYGVELLEQSYKNDKHKWVWKCKCGECGNIFESLPSRVLNGHKKSCGCSRKSSGELLIENFLKSENVNYQSEYSLKEENVTHPLRLDFYLPDIQVGIEYNGRQHYFPSEFFGGEEAFSRRIENDRQKQKYCDEHDIILIVIPYYMEENEIITLLTNIIYPERLSRSA